MTTKAEIMLKLNKLSQGDQEKLLAFIETLPSGKPPVGPRKSILGLFEHRGIDIPPEVFEEARKEAWASFPREFPQADNR